MFNTAFEIFENDRKQAVWIPKQFRFQGNKVKIRKKGEKSTYQFDPI
jgi:virulence-associated protein VagC